MAFLDFIAFLSKEGMIDIARLKEDNDRGVLNLLKVNRYVYLAMQRYNLGLDYPYTICLSGPYSPELTEDCEELDTAKTSIEPDLPAFKKEEFLSALKGKSPGWLEVAGMIIFYTNEKKSVPKMDYIYWVISEYPPEFIDAVYADMRSLNIA